MNQIEKRLEKLECKIAPHPGVKVVLLQPGQSKESALIEKGISEEELDGKLVFWVQLV